LDLGQDFTFLIFAELDRSLERIFSAVVVLDVETLVAQLSSSWRPDDSEIENSLPAASAIENLCNTMNPGSIRIHRLCEEGQILDLMFANIESPLAMTARKATSLNEIEHLLPYLPI